MIFSLWESPDTIGNLLQGKGSDQVRLQTVIDYTVYALIRTAFAAIQAVSVQRMQPISRGMAYLLSDVLKIRSRVIDRNLKIVSPNATPEQIRRVRRDLWEHLVLMACEIAWSRRRLHLCSWRKFLDFPSSKYFLQPFMEGRPVVLVSGHYGNFEVGGYATGLFRIPTMTVARKLDNPFLDRYINQFRSTNGQQLVDKDGSAEIIQQHLESGGTLSIVADQFAGVRGCWVHFFGEPTSCHKALALFTLTNDAPMGVYYARRTSGPLHFEIGCAGVADPRDGGPHMQGVTELTRWYNQRLEDVISVCPEQYWWMHRRWRDVPEKVARRLAKQVA